MKDTRLFKRIPCDGVGQLALGKTCIEASAVNLSKGGVCLTLSEKTWLEFGLEELSEVRGRLTVDGDLFQFQARICWSNTTSNKVFFGVEFLEHDKHVIDSVLERLSVIDDPPPGDTFNI